MENNFDQTLEPFLTNSFGDRFLFSVNRNSFSKMSAEQVSDNFFGKDYFKEDHFYLIVGTDSGTLINYFQNKGVPDGTRIVFLELPDIITRLSEIVDLEKIDPCITVTDMSSISAKLEEFQLRKYIFANRLVILKSICATDAFRPEYYELYLQTKTDLQEAAFAIQSNLGEHLFMVKQLENLTENRVSSECLRGKFNGKTAVLLAVGPSLDEAIPWVKKNRDSLVVIAVSRAARKLYHAGLSPHIIVTIDPSDASFDISREMLNFFEDTLFIYGKHSSPPLVGQWRGQALYVGERFPWDTPLNEPTFDHSGPTVTQTSLQAAIEMGFSRVILAGVDLCFSRDGYAYSSNVVGREKGTKTGDLPGGVQTNGGWVAGTLIPYLAGARILERQARSAAEKGCQVVNMSAGAMKIEGIDYCPQEQLQIEPQDIHCETIIAANLPADTSIERLEHYRLMEKELTRARKAVISIGRLAESALKANKNMFHPAGQKNPGKFKRQMDRIEKTISTQFDDFPRFLKSYGIMRFLKIVKPNRAEWSDKRIQETAHLYYEAYRTTAKEVTSLIDETLNRIQIRQMEESSKYDFAQMADQWEQDRQFGRYLLWQDRNPEARATLNDKNRNRFAWLEAHFQKIMALEEDINQKKPVPKDDLDEIRSHALIAFRRGQTAGLENLANNLKLRNDPEAHVLANMALGYRAELLQDYEQAFEFYQQVIEAGKPVLTEDALLRIATVSSDKKDYSTFEMALECLAGLSPLYAPKYGDILWLVGKKEQTLEVYADYLENVPGDTRALLQLGQYYLAMGLSDGARMVYGFVLEQDPENKTAKTLLANLEDGS